LLMQQQRHPQSSLHVRPLVEFSHEGNNAFVADGTGRLSLAVTTAGSPYSAIGLLVTTGDTSFSLTALTPAMALAKFFEDLPCAKIGAKPAADLLAKNCSKYSSRLMTATPAGTNCRGKCLRNKHTMNFHILIETVNDMQVLTSAYQFQT
jgi:hypothetical protein